MLLLFPLLASTTDHAACSAGLTYPNTGGGGHGLYSNTTESDFAACCGKCQADSRCKSWTYISPEPKKLPYNASNGECNLRTGPATKHSGVPGKITGAVTRPTPVPTPRPTPAPVPAGSQRNIIFLVTDDQDLRLGSMRAMPMTMKLLKEGGTNFSNFFVHTPICCPSRTTMLSGKYQHNNRVSGPNARGCMRQNTSQTVNPQWWQRSFVKTLHDHGYTTGLFGKTLNSWTSYGCDNSSDLPDGVDRQLVMCDHNFFNQHWVNDSIVTFTGSKPEDYTTSVMGNATVEWISSVLAQGPTHPPFFAWLGPHAPHLPSTPAPWYADHPIGKLQAPRDEPYYNYSAKDHHALLADQPIINEADALAIDTEYSARLRSLLSVDDIVAALHALLDRVGEWDNTYLVYTSDHGYSQGQYRLCSHKMQVYDNNLRVPMLMHGPGISKGTEIPQVTSMVDVGPTILDLAGVGVPAYMDGHSWKPLLQQQINVQNNEDPQPQLAWREVALVEYQSIAQNFSGKLRHPVDGVNNTYIALRVINSTHDLLYAEFTDVSKPVDWDFADGTINFHELYNITEDYYELKNIYSDASDDFKRQLHTQLHAYFHCDGQAECP